MSNPPDCFGKDTDYSETSRICLGCGWRWDCKSKVNSKANQVSSWGSARSTAKKKATNGDLAPVTAGKALLAVGSSPYNHNKELAPQFFKYLGYSVVEVTLEEGLNLVRSSREHFAQENMKDAISLIVQNEDKDG